MESNTQSLTRSLYVGGGYDLAHPDSLLARHRFNKGKELLVWSALNMRTALKLAEMRGVVLLAAAQAQISSFSS